MFSKRCYPHILRRGVTLAKKPRLEEATVSASIYREYSAEEENCGEESPIDQIKSSYHLMPHLPLIALLEKLPLVDLLPLRAVCQRWDDLATNIVVKKRTHLCLTSYYNTVYEKATQYDNVRVRIDLSRFMNVDLTSFDFIIGIDETLYREWRNDKIISDNIKIPEPWGRFLFLKRHMVAKKLTSTFPAIQKLVIFDCMFNEEEIEIMLTSWCSTLTSLKLVIADRDFNWTPIFAALNEMPRLQHVSLFSPFGFISRPKLPFLCQLKSFQFTFFKPNIKSRQCWLSHLLGQLDPTVLQQVDVGMFTSQNNRNCFFRYNLKQLYLSHPKIAAKLKRLQFPSISPKFFHFIVSQFTSVSWLDIELSSVNDLKQISRLRGLQFLALRSNKRPFSDCPLNRALNKRSKRTMTDIRPMVSVTRLLLLDFEIDEKLLRKLFPNVIKVERHRRGDNNDTE